MENQIDKITNEQLFHNALKNNWAMNTLEISIPFSYFLETVKLNWNDVLFAIDNGFLSYQAAIENAILEFEKSPNYFPAVLSLASLFPEDLESQYLAHGYLEELSELVSKEEKNESKDKILFVLLSWIYENKTLFEDPFMVVEIIYDDFGFPTSMKGFVRYMPTERIHFPKSKEEGIQYMYSQWENYLNIQRAIFPI